MITNIPTDTHIVINYPNDTNTIDVPMVDGWVGTTELASVVHTIATGVYHGYDDDGIGLTLVVTDGGTVWVDYDMCGMMGCPTDAPHNHPTWAV